MSKKRVILANGSRLLREMLHRVLAKAKQLEVEEIANPGELAPAIDRLDPEWVILTSPHHDHAPDPASLDAWLLHYPSVRFVILSPDYSSMRARSPDSREEDLRQLSLRDFIHVLEQDLQPS